MKIEDRREENMIPFHALDKGDVFVAGDGNFYMKVGTIPSSPTNAVQLKDGEQAIFDIENRVEYIDSVLEVG